MGDRPDADELERRMFQVEELAERRAEELGIEAPVAAASIDRNLVELAFTVTCEPAGVHERISALLRLLQAEAGLRVRPMKTTTETREPRVASEPREAVPA